MEGRAPSRPRITFGHEGAWPSKKRKTRLTPPRLTGIMPGVSVKFLWNFALTKRTTAVFRVLMTAGLMSVTVLATVAAQPQNRVRILRVEHIVDAATNTAGEASLTNSQLPKFADATATAPRELFSVYWEPAGTAPEGTLVTFEYTQALSPGIKFLFTKYEWPVDGEEKAFFAINTGGSRPAGRVMAWRTRVVYRGRLLAETRSKTWR
jgi:hypothetical protein